MDSILDSVKKALGIHAEYTNFDPDIIMHINTVFGILNQLNIGPPEGFMIEDNSMVWDEYITSLNLTMVKTYIYLKVRLMFDPPTSSALIESINGMISELEWRLYVEGNHGTEGGENDE
ncbi:MAG: hypothetical protein IJ022_03425 [Burkholderiaceae bacterium]|nr:hypothetical protein [Burkholderiaceae bacterium]